MAEWPKTIYVKGIGVAINSWDEFDELVERYGADGPLVVGQSNPSGNQTVDRKNASSLQPSDRSLLEQFVTSAKSGVPTKQLGPAIGKSGKAIRPALDAWSRKIGLVTHDGAAAFESVKGAKGRGFRLTHLAGQTARAMLGK